MWQRQLLEDDSARYQDVVQDKLSEEQHTTDSILLLIMIMLLFISILVIWRFKVKRYMFVHETGVSLIFGLIAGLLMDTVERSNGSRVDNPATCNITLRLMEQQNATYKGAATDIESEAVFDPELFFYVLLPPIIFFAGYDLKQKHFFRNIGAILTFAFVGTVMACFITGGLLLAYVNSIDDLPLIATDCFLFGALISATDPVTVLAIFHDLGVEDRLYAIVFGESVLNDAVAIVLYRSISDFKPEIGRELTVGAFFYSIWVFILIFFGSFACGSFIGMISSIFFKFSKIQAFPLLETSMFVLLSYASFLLGEGFGLSGVVAVLFCGISQAHYTFPTLSQEAGNRSRELFELLNFLAENFLFSYVGLNVFTYRCHRWDAGFIAFSIFVVLLSRACHVVPLSWVINKFRRKGTPALTWQYQSVMWWSGLRGAIAFALAIRNTSTVAHQMILSTTLVIVMVTVLFFGGTTPAVLDFLSIQTGHQEADPNDQYMLAGNRVGKPVKGWLASMWQGVDRRFIRPVVSITPDMQGTGTYQEVKDTLHNYWHGIPEPSFAPPRSPRSLRSRANTSTSTDGQPAPDAWAGPGNETLPSSDSGPAGAFSPDWDRTRANDPFSA